MKIWIDADACPNKIKEILFRAAKRTETLLILVANHSINTPASPFIKKWLVEVGIDSADNKIVQHIQENELLITADIPLAHAVVLKNAIALNPRGELYTENNIKQILAMRNLNESLRETGMLKGGGSTLKPAEIHRFSRELDTILAKYKQK